MKYLIESQDKKGEKHESIVECDVSEKRATELYNKLHRDDKYKILSIKKV